MLLIEQTSVASAALPVAEFSEHLRLGSGFADDGLQDTVLESCLRAAVSSIEARTGKALIEKQYLLSITGWKQPGWHPIPVAPVTGLVSLALIDRAGTATAVDAAYFGLQADLSVPRLVSPGAFPEIPSGGAAELVFTAGFGANWTGLPDDLLRAVYVLAADYYEKRFSGAEAGADYPFAVQLLIERYRRMRVGAS